MSFYKKNQKKNTAHDEMMKTQFANEVSLRHLANLSLQGASFLDPGCGVSTSLPAFLNKEGAAYKLLDYKQSTVEAMEDALEEEHLPVNVSQGNIMKLDFPDGSFDYVHERLVLMHVHDPAAGIRECLRIARKAAFFVSIDWGTFRWKTPWVGDFYREALAFIEGRGSNMSFGGRVLSLLPPGVNFTCTPYDRPWGNHGYIITSMCDTLLGQIKSEPASAQSDRLLNSFSWFAHWAGVEGQDWLKPALMSVVTVKKEGEPIRDGLSMGAL